MLLSEQLLIITVASSYETLKYNYKAINIAIVLAAKKACDNETDQPKELVPNAYGDMAKA